MRCINRTVLGLLCLALVATGVPVWASSHDGEEKDSKVDLHWFGTLRARPEYNENLSDLFAGRDDKIAYVSYRANIGLEAHFDRDVNLLLDAQVLGVWGEDGTPFRGALTQDTTSAKINFFQAYAEAENIFGSAFSLRGGRQTLVYGDEWLLGDLDFYGGTSYDGLRGDFNRMPKNGKGQFSLFWAKLAEANTPEMVSDRTNPLSQDTNGDNTLYGFWGNWMLPHNQTVDTGLIYRLDHQEQLNTGGAGVVRAAWVEKRWTWTAQYHYGKETGGFATVNGAYQWGKTLPWNSGTDTYDETDIDAWAAEGTGGYAWNKGGKIYKVWARLAQYTGDDEDTADTDESFDILYQDFHGRYGLLDFWTGAFGFTPFLGGSPGFRAVMLGFNAELPNNLDLFGYVEKLTRDQSKPGAQTGNRNLGQEFGLSIAYNYGKHLHLELGFAQLYPGTSASLEEPWFGKSTTRRVYVNTVLSF